MSVNNENPQRRPWTEARRVKPKLDLWSSKFTRDGVVNHVDDEEEEASEDEAYIADGNGVRRADAAIEKETYISDVNGVRQQSFNGATFDDEMQLFNEGPSDETLKSLRLTSEDSRRHNGVNRSSDRLIGGKLRKLRNVARNEIETKIGKDTIIAFNIVVKKHAEKILKNGAEFCISFVWGVLVAYSFVPWFANGIDSNVVSPSPQIVWIRFAAALLTTIIFFVVYVIARISFRWYYDEPLMIVPLIRHEIVAFGWKSLKYVGAYVWGVFLSGIGADFLATKIRGSLTSEIYNETIQNFGDTFTGTFVSYLFIVLTWGCYSIIHNFSRRRPRHDDDDDDPLSKSHDGKMLYERIRRDTEFFSFVSNGFESTGGYVLGMWLAFVFLPMVTANVGYAALSGERFLVLIVYVTAVVVAWTWFEIVRDDAAVRKDYEQRRHLWTFLNEMLIPYDDVKLGRTTKKFVVERPPISATRGSDEFTMIRMHLNERPIPHQRKSIAFWFLRNVKDLIHFGYAFFVACFVVFGVSYPLCDAWMSGCRSPISTGWPNHLSSADTFGFTLITVGWMTLVFYLVVFRREVFGMLTSCFVRDDEIDELMERYYPSYIDEDNVSNVIVKLPGNLTFVLSWAFLWGWWLAVEVVAFFQTVFGFPSSQRVFVTLGSNLLTSLFLSIAYSFYLYFHVARYQRTKPTNLTILNDYDADERVYDFTTGKIVHAFYAETKGLMLLSRRRSRRDFPFEQEEDA